MEGMPSVLEPNGFDILQSELPHDFATLSCYYRVTHFHLQANNPLLSFLKIVHLLPSTPNAMTPHSYCAKIRKYACRQSKHLNIPGSVVRKLLL